MRRAAVAPEGVERAQIFAGEQAFDAGAAECAGHHPLELAAPAELHRAGRRSEVGDDAGEHLIAFLPVAAGDVKRQPGPVAVLRRPAEGDVRALGREAPLLDDHLVRRVAIGQFGRDRQVRGKRQRRKRPPLVAGVVGVRRARVGERRRHRRHAGWRRHDQVPLAAVLGKPSRRPVEHVVQRRSAGEPQAGQLLEVGEAREIDVGHRRVEVMGRLRLRAERLDRVLELRGAAVELRACVPDFEGVLRPPQRAEQRREAIRVHARERARERAGQIAVRVGAGLEKLEHAGEVAVAGHLPRLVLEEQLAHARKVDARLHLVALVGPVRRRRPRRAPPSSRRRCPDRSGRDG